MSQLVENCRNFPFFHRLVAVGLVVGVAWWNYRNLEQLRNSKPHPVLYDRQHYLNIAHDISTHLKCEQLFNETLQQRKDDDYFGNMSEDIRDDVHGDGRVGITAKHLFCLAASSSPPEEIVEQVGCNVVESKRTTILDLWSAARAQIPVQLLLQVLDLAKERQNQELLGKTYNLWAPEGDDGLSYMVHKLRRSDNNADNGGIQGLQKALGPGKLFVDIGSCLGMTALAITSKYPGTKVVSLEPASPNWLLQEMNLRCNLEHDEFTKIKLVLAGVGPNNVDEDNMMAKLMWRPTATTSTRAWTPAEEHQSKDIELVVRLRRLKSILAEADVFDVPIDVLNVDCEGCEYNLIPALSEEEFDAIPTVMGGVHWGYIPTAKLPSSERAKTTHQRLCHHENIAKTTKECCAFPDMPVKSSVPGGGTNPKASTVKDHIIEGMCDDFDQWAKWHYLFDVKDDWGWFEVSSQA